MNRKRYISKFHLILLKISANQRCQRTIKLFMAECLQHELHEAALQSLFVCYFPTLLAGKYQVTNIMIFSSFLIFFPYDSDYKDNVAGK